MTTHPKQLDRPFENSTGVSTVNISKDESGQTFTNIVASAKANYNLPQIPTDRDLNYRLIVTEDDGMRITAASGDRIRRKTDLSIDGGYIDSVVVGSVLRLQAIKDGSVSQWVATRELGTWTVETS